MLLQFVIARRSWPDGNLAKTCRSGKSAAQASRVKTIAATKELASTDPVFRSA